jgi:hypothetical protein
MKKQLLKLVYFFLRVVSLIYILNLIIMMSGNSNIEATNFIRNDINSIYSIETDGTRELNVNKIIFHMIIVITMYMGTLKLILNFSEGLR